MRDLFSEFKKTLTAGAVKMSDQLAETLAGILTRKVHGLGYAQLQPQAALDILAERRRQIEAEGWTPEHDDHHTDGEMGRAAATYLILAVEQMVFGRNHEWLTRMAERLWPWSKTWLKPNTCRRNLVKAGALILAEIERLDRAAERAADQAETDRWGAGSAPDRTRGGRTDG